MAKPLWKQRNFMLLWGGQFVSYIGTDISSIAIPLIVLSLTGSPAQAGTVAALRGFVYVLLSIPVGVLVDRWNRKVVMIIGNLGSGFAVGSIALALILHHLTINQLYIVSIIEGIFYVFANLARYTAFTRVVSKEQIPSAIAQWRVADNVSFLVGPPLGGFIYQTIGAFVAFFTDALSYFTNAILVFFINTSLTLHETNKRKAIHHEAQEAIVWYWKQPLMKFISLLQSGQIILESGIYLLIVVLAKELHASSFVIGSIFATGAIGGIIGSLLSAKIHKRFGFRKLIIASILIIFLTFSSYAIAINIYLLALITAIFYAVSPLLDVVTTPYTTSIIPNNIRGRVAGVTRVIDQGSISVGYFVTGFLLEYVGSIWTIWIFSFFLLLLFIMTLTNKNLHNVKTK